MQACQSVHAALDFSVRYAGLVKQWHLTSNTLVLLAAEDELALSYLAEDIERADHKVVRFYEPDLDGALTAVAFEPSSAPLLSHLPLALREEVKS